MAGAKLWAGVGVAVQSALATAVTVGSNGVTKANPGVCTYTGTDPAEDSYVVFTDVVGMYQLNDVVVRANNVNGAGNTFELEGINTTNFDTMTSANVSEITFGTTLATAVGVSASGGEFEFVDKTTIHDLIRSRIPSVASPITFTFSCLWDPADAALAAFKSASDTKAKRAVRLTFADGSKFLIYGYIGFAFVPTGNAQELVTCQVVIEAAGRPTAYAT